MEQKVYDKKPANGKLKEKTAKSGAKYLSGLMSLEGKKYFISVVKNPKATNEYAFSVFLNYAGEDNYKKDDYKKPEFIEPKEETDIMF